MILGILADTHGRHLRARRAIEVVRRAAAEVIIHCGDVGGEGVLGELAAAAAEMRPGGCRDSAGRYSPVWFVWGNTDVPSPAMSGLVRSLALPLPGAVPLRLECGGKRIAVFHGHEIELEAFDARLVDYVLHGHTHVCSDKRIGGTRIINPGALHRTRRYTVAVLDTATDVLQSLAVEDAEG